MVRGVFIDEEALYEVIEFGVVVGVVIDVFSEELAIGNILIIFDCIVVIFYLAVSMVEV